MAEDKPQKEIDLKKLSGLFVNKRRLDQKKKTRRVKTEQTSIVFHVAKEIGISKDQAAYLLKDMAALKMKEIDPTFKRSYARKPKKKADQ